MDAEELMADFAEEAGWKPRMQLKLALQYIESQDDNEAFSEFLDKQPKDEQDDED